MTVYNSALMSIIYGNSPINTATANTIQFKQDILNRLSGDIGNDTITLAEGFLGVKTVQLGDTTATITPNIHGGSTLEIDGLGIIVGRPDVLGGEVFKLNGEIFGKLVKNKDGYSFNSIQASGFDIKQGSAGISTDFEPQIPLPTISDIPDSNYNRESFDLEHDSFEFDYLFEVLSNDTLIDLIGEL